MAAMLMALTNWAGWRALSYLGIVLLGLLELGTIQRTHQRGTGVVATLVLTALIAAVWVALTLTYRPGRHAAIDTSLLVILGAASVGLLVASPQGAAIIGVIVALSGAAIRLTPIRGAVYATVLIVAYLVVEAYTTQFNPITVLSIGLGLLFAYVATSSVARLRAEEAHARGLLDELQASRDAQVEAAAIAERARIAREIHDVLAHTLAALAVQLESARVMLEKRASDPEALATVERSHRLAREGLDEVRRAVSALRGDHIPGPEQLRELVTDFETDTGVESDFRVEGEARRLTSEAQLALYRAAQEALTNVRKHARPSRVEVALRYAADGTELRVVDVGEAPAADADGGYGLVGMRERAELLGGKLEAGSTGDGFQVRLWLPE